MLRTPITPWRRVPTLDHSAGFQARLCLYSTSSKAIWATVKHMKLGTRGHTAGLFFRPAHIGRSTSARALCPYKKVALSSNSVRLRHAEEQSMRTSRPPGMGRRCAPRRQYRPPSGDPHPGDGAMASRPSRRSITCPRRLSGSPAPPLAYAGREGGWTASLIKNKSLVKAPMPWRTVKHGGARTQEGAGRL